jgi:hypothetical protein
MPDDAAGVAGMRDQNAPRGGLAQRAIDLVDQHPWRAFSCFGAIRIVVWTLTPTLRLDDQRALALTPSHMVVSPAPVVDTLSLISMSVPPALLPFIGLILIIFAAIGAWTFGLVGTAAQGDVHDEIE